MNINIFESIWTLGTNPGKAWPRFAGEVDGKEGQELFLRTFYYPLLGMVGMAVFIGAMWNFKGDTLGIDRALKDTCLQLMVMFSSYFLCSLALNKLYVRFFGQADDMARVGSFVGYAYSVYYIIVILMALFPGAFFYLKFGVLYIVYLVYEGSRYYYRLPDSKRMRFTTLTACVMAALPWGIEFVLTKLMPGLS